MSDERRLRAAGYVPLGAIDGRMLWRHPDFPERTFWSAEALAHLERRPEPVEATNRVLDASGRN